MARARLGQPVSRRLGDLLIAERLVTPEQLRRALDQQAAGEKLGAALVRLGALGEEQLVGFLSRQYGLPSITVTDLDVDPDVVRLVPPSIARKHEVLPVRRDGSTLTLAMADPTNVFAIDDVAFLTNLQVVPVVASQAAIRRAIERSYGPAAAVTPPGEDAPSVEVVGAEPGPAAEVADAREAADEAPVVRLVNAVIADAVQKGASDIHFEPYEKEFRIRLRVDGVLRESATPPKRLEPAIISRLKIMANLDIAERRLPQDGRIRLRHRSRDIDVRVSVLPTISGEKAVLRILDRDAVALDLARLGFDPWSLERFTTAISEPHGMILITGPTGSGKTTTLYAAIQAINAPGRNIVTAEDPVEYHLRGVNQVQINESVGRTFASTLRSFLRQDPDVILVGETRDLETAQMAIRAALTGHLVLSTLHTNDAPSTVARLVDMGAPPFLLASALSLVVAQRLVRRVCVECREAREVDEAWLLACGHEPVGVGGATIHQGKGCAACGFTGMKGRVAVYEVMPVTPDLRDMILKGASTAALRRAAQSHGMKTLRQAGVVKALDGVTTMEEVLRVTMTE